MSTNTSTSTSHPQPSTSSSSSKRPRQDAIIAEGEESQQRLAVTLMSAASTLSAYCLIHAAKWTTELLAGLPSDHSVNLQDATASSHSELFSIQLGTDTAHALAKVYFDCRELRQCSDAGRKSGSFAGIWLALYAEYLHIKELSASATDTKDLYTTKLPQLLKDVSQLLPGQDAFKAYLQALILADLARREEAICCLVNSVNLYPYNWSAWLRLTDLLDGEEQLLNILPSLPQSVMTKIFHVNASLEVHRAFEHLRDSIDQLMEIFPTSVHLKAQRALLEYHLRDFDLAEQLFDDIAKDYPHRMEDIDTYSNILYVMGRRAKLSQLAHRYVTVDRNRPETCCLVGNLYSLRGDHTKAIAQFRRATKLDPSYLSAWTLMGHEYVELSNTHAAIECYRRACDANCKDYRAWYGLGQAYELLNMHAYALRYFQRAASLRPFDSRMWQALGHSYARLAKPHETLKCFKRAQLFAEPDDISLLKRLGEQCLSMHLFEEAALYWMRILDAAETHELPDEEILPIYNLLASYEMGECHLAQNRPRVVGDLSAAEGYINKVLQSEGEDAEHARRLQHVLRQLQVT